jgi:Flp pilus assembly protein TadD
MYRTANSHRVFGLAVTTAMAGALLSGCTTTAAPQGLASARAAAPVSARAQSQAVSQAEAAALADPRNPATRVALGNAYLKVGRFGSAATSFNDAMALGDTSPRTALTLALALLGEGKQVEAATLLNRWQDKIAPADAGLALALSGQAERGIYLMSQAIRGGQNDSKIRQNLAYAYALGGHWREARLMAAQDVPADQLGARMEQWATSAQSDAWQTRVAGLLDVPAGIRDAGQPTQLALANNASLQQLAAEATAPVPLPAAATELPALASAVSAEPAAPLPPVVTPAVSAPVAVAEAAPPAAPALAPEAPAPATFAAAFVAPAAASSPLAAVAPHDAARFAEAQIVRTPAVRERIASAPRVAASGEATHLIQLGSFASEAGARRAWQIYNNKYPELAGHQLVISEAVVRGKHYWRVSAGGYGRTSSANMCGRVRGGGAGCFAYAEGRPLPGAIDRGIRLASR